MICLENSDFKNGKILIDDISIKKYDIQKLRSQIGIVNQDSFLFSDSISNNINKFEKNYIKLKEENKNYKLPKLYNWDLISRKYLNLFQNLVGDQ